MDEELPIDALSYIDTEYSDNAQMQQSVYAYVCVLKSPPALTAAPIRVSLSCSHLPAAPRPSPLWRFTHDHGMCRCFHALIHPFVPYMFPTRAPLYVCYATRKSRLALIEAEMAEMQRLGALRDYLAPYPLPTLAFVRAPPCTQYTDSCLNIKPDMPQFKLLVSFRIASRAY